MGQAHQVLDEVTRLRADLATLPAASGPDEAVTPWDVREALLDAGRSAALRLGRHADALILNAEVVASLRDRRAPATDTARARFGDYFPLLSLGRIEEALQMLLDCRQAFQDARDTEMLGKTLGALANAEDERGHVDAAIHLQRDALRYNYIAGDVSSIVVSYHFLGRYLRHARQFTPALASHLAAALVSFLTGAGDIHQSVPAAATDLRELGTSAVPPAAVPPAAVLPADVADLCRQVDAIPGKELPGLLAALSPDPETAEQALRDLIAQVQELAATPPAEADPDLA
jgi:tetratricopeptide (TPR) repeat protein